MHSTQALLAAELPSFGLSTVPEASNIENVKSATDSSVGMTKRLTPHLKSHFKDMSPFVGHTTQSSGRFAKTKAFSEEDEKIEAQYCS